MKSLLLCFILLCAAMLLSAQTPQWQWAQAAGSVEDDFAMAVALDGAGNSYVVGSFAGTVTFGATTLTSVSSTGDVFAAKLDSAGNWLWARRAGGAGYHYCSAVATDARGNCFITGSYFPSIEIGSATLTSVGWFDIYVAKLDPDGNWLWAVSAGGTAINSIPTDMSCDISTDGAGNCYISGSFYEAATFGSTTLTCFGEESNDDLFVAKLDTNGNWLGAVSAGGPAEDCAYSIWTDAAGNSYLAGSFCGNAAFGAINLASGGFYDYEVFAAKLDPSGNWLWASGAGGENDDVASAIHGDGSGNCYLTGEFGQSAMFGSITLTSDDFNWYDLFIAKLDSNGVWLWARQAGGDGEDDSFSVSGDANGCCYVTGYFMASAAFGPFALTSSGYSDVFAAKLSPGGDWIWAIKAGGPSLDDYSDIGTCIATDAAGNSRVSGDFSETASFGAIQLSGMGGYDIFIAKLSPSGTGIDDEVQNPTSSFQMSNYPNPFNPETTISYTLPSAGSVSLEIYNSRGQLVRSLLREEQPTGEHSLIWNGTDDSGHSVASGLYLCRIVCNGKEETRKLLLIK